ncbi:MAG: hypothetical protein JNN07_08615 [Verrucomicrobiales bacterium]|nr:hypothetical protein [Verrucomicrobiales bacterium]
MTPSQSPWTRRALSAALVLTFTTSVVSAAVTYSDAVLADQPVAYWRFNDGLTVPVPDLAANLGSLGAAATGSYNGANHPAPGALGKGTDTAASVSGGTHVGIPFQESLNPNGPFTAEGWFKPGTVITDPAVLTCAMSSGDFLAPRAGWLIYQGSGGFNFRLYNQNGLNTSASVTGGGPLSLNTWYHVVAVYDGAEAILYVNGEEVGRQAVSGYVAGLAGSFVVGMRADNGFGWNGTADEVAFYGAALTPEQISNHYANGLSDAPLKEYSETVLADAPLGYWRLNEGAFTPPVAANAGSLAAVGQGAYRGGAINSTEAPKEPAFIGFEPGNTSLGLDGINSYVSTVQGLLNGKRSYTVSGWIRRGADQLARTGLWGQNDLMEFGYIDNTTIQAYTDGALDLRPGPFANDEWGHLAVVSDGSSISIYANGVLALSRTHSTPADNSFFFNIGGGGVFDGGGNFFIGQIDEVAVYDKALSAFQICNQYAAAVAKAPEVAGEMVPVTVFAGTKVQVSSVICGSPSFSYQWYRSNGSLVAGANGAALVIPNAQVSDSGDYFVRVSNDYGTVDSELVTVTVEPASLPLLEPLAASLTRYAGTKAVLAVTASGTPPFTYQWQRNNADIPGATSARLTLDELTTAAAGDYRVIVKNPVGDTASSVSVLTVKVPVVGSYEATVVATRPSAYWRLGESDGPTAFDYAGGFDGIYTSVTFGSTGSIAGDSDTAVDFNGNDSSVTTPASLNALSAFTLTGWIRRGGTQAARTGLFGQNDLIEFGFIDDTTLEAYFSSGDSIDITSPVADETWAFVALRGTSTGASLFVDGQALGRVDGNFSSYGSTSFGFNIGGGGIFDGTGNTFSGGIDEVTIHDRALGDDELCRLYLSGTGAPLVLTVAATESGYALTWPCGVLQSASSLNLDGTASWTDVPAATSPFSLAGLTGQKFYRVRY